MLFTHACRPFVSVNGHQRITGTWTRTYVSVNELLLWQCYLFTEESLE